MSKTVLKNVGIKIDGNDLSSQIQQATLNYSANTEEVQAMGDNSIKRLSALKDFSIEVTFYNDFSDGGLDSILFPLIGADSKAVKLIVDSSAAVGTSNPMFTGNAIVQSYPPLGPEVGGTATTSVTLQGDGDLTRDTSGTF